MKISLRWRIAIAFTGLAAGVFLLLGSYLHSRVQTNTTRVIRTNLMAETHLVAAALRDIDLAPGESLQAKVKELDQLAGVRVTIIGADGQVLADSRYDPSGMENHSNRPERLAAVRSGEGYDHHYSETLGIDMLYTAVSLAPEGVNSPVVRLAMPLYAVAEASIELRHALIGLFVLAALFVWVASVWLLGNLTEPVRIIANVSRRVGEGDLEARVEGIHGTELEALGGVFNNTLDRLADLLARSRRESRYYATILEQMTDAVLVTDHERRVQFVNRAFAKRFNVDANHVAGHFIDEVVLNYGFSNLIARASEQGVTQRDEVRLLRPEARTLIGIATPLLGEEGEILGAVGLLHDITDLQRVEQVRRDFVGNASHELRTPAAGIRALAEALQAGALTDPVRGPEFLQQIVDSVTRLTDILDDMMTLTRVERGNELLHPEWVPVQEAFDSAVAQIGRAVIQRQIEMRTECGADDKAFVDPSGLETVMVNLLGNAVKYTPDGGKVILEGHGVAGGYEITVADTGVGIPAESQPRIFERFYRVDKARDRATGGTGLGLSIVKHICEAHGGRVSVTSVEGEGSAFRIFLPDPRAGGDSGK